MYSESVVALQVLFSRILLASPICAPGLQVMEYSTVPALRMRPSSQEPDQRSRHTITIYILEYKHPLTQVGKRLP